MEAAYIEYNDPLHCFFNLTAAENALRKIKGLTVRRIDISSSKKILVFQPKEKVHEVSRTLFSNGCPGIIRLGEITEIQTE